MSDVSTSLPSSTAALSAARSAASPETVVVTARSVRVEPAHSSSESWFIQRINPVSRFIGALLMSLPMFITLDVVSACTALGLELVLLWIGGINPLRVLRRTWPVWIAAVGGFLTVFLYGKASGDVYFHWGIIDITQGSVSLSIATFARVGAVAMPSVILALGLDPTDLADGLVQLLHLSPRFVYGGLAGLRMMTLLKEDWHALGLSRRSRGLGDGGRVRAVATQSFNLLVLSIRRATKLATAMEARGFGGDTDRSAARVSKVHAVDWIFYAIALAIPVVALSAAVVTGNWHFAFGSV
ncbi:MAG: energy-coupling factor transporter transmembrane protein EcfT [Bifidobacteriaceae bacterium]|jgi:energy-coupling factor transporter transmembrane protein EcfT|nr:energy-coupling factor transporter transmembrane protein EcfT [Bifidobacteriaceae bacterium]